MSSPKILVSLNSDSDLLGSDLVLKAIDPEIQAFEKWMQSRDNGNSSLTPMERELLRAYLYQKITGAL